MSQLLYCSYWQALLRLLKSNNLKIAWTRMELVDENLVIDLTEKQKLSYE